MTGKRKLAYRAAFLAAIAMSLATFAVIFLWRPRGSQQILLIGAVIRQDSDPSREVPIADVEVGVADDMAAQTSKSERSRLFRVRLRAGIERDQPITLTFRHPNYEPLDLTEQVAEKLYIVRMKALQKDVPPSPNQPATIITNVLVRYSSLNTRAVNAGTGAKIFQVVNSGDLPCGHQLPCSPDGKWRAAIGGASLDAGAGNVFENARFVCIAGPCPFTAIESDGFTKGGRIIKVAVRNWSDTATFLLQAELFRSEINNVVQTAYPVILGTGLVFTLPATAEGTTIEAEVNGVNTVFPLGPQPTLSWADCDLRSGMNQTKVLRCELKDGYQFR